MKDCIIRKLRDIGICGASINPFLYDIFGKQEATHHFKGLVDCDTASMFDEQLLKLATEWNDRECAIRSTSSPLFHDWFTKYQSGNFKAHMLKPLRIKAGLGDPPMAYTNNANESANAKIKAKVNYKKSDLHMFCNEMKSLVERQFCDVERAFTLNTGPYEVAQTYISHKENATKWVKRSEQYKQRVINAIYKIPLAFAPKQPDDDAMMNAGTAVSTVNHEGMLPTHVTAPVHVPLSISWKDAGMPRELYESM